jgi:hypothetical protein
MSTAMYPTMTDIILDAFDEQRDPINDADLDGEQPVTLRVTFSLSDLRALRQYRDRVRRHYCGLAR